MMREVLKILRDRGYERAYLSAYRESARARRFYEVVGFSETGHTTETHFPDDVVVVNIEYVNELANT